MRLDSGSVRPMISPLLMKQIPYRSLRGTIQMPESDGSDSTGNIPCWPAMRSTGNTQKSGRTIGTTEWSLHLHPTPQPLGQIRRNKMCEVCSKTAMVCLQGVQWFCWEHYCEAMKAMLAP